MKTANSQPGLSALVAVNSQVGHRNIAPWPEPIRPEGFHGVLGDFLSKVMPHTEADPAAVVLQSLVCVGSLIGREVWFEVGGSRHHTNLFLALVGATGAGRKGTSWGPVSKLMHLVDRNWADTRIRDGLSTGEGLIFHVRDALTQQGSFDSGIDSSSAATNCSDVGVADKRLLCLEEELAAIFMRGKREGNTLSPVLRSAWDGKSLGTLTKKDPNMATGAHISLIGHITQEELRSVLSQVDIRNGLGNRFLWACSKRSKVLPSGGELTDEMLVGHADRLRQSLHFVRGRGQIRFTPRALVIWEATYEDLTTGRPGSVGALSARAAPLVRRIALIFAMLDCSPEVDDCHLLAALAMWDYCYASCMHTFSGPTLDPIAARILDGLQDRGKRGMSRSEISGLLGKNVCAEQIDGSLGLLSDLGLAARQDRESCRQPKVGRPAEVWVARQSSVVEDDLTAAIDEINEINEKTDDSTPTWT